jgi:hypothetical protein
VVAQNDRMVAINSALQVDLTGQVCADSLGTRPYSGFGGQLDFIRGAARSKGGVPIIALPSTAMHGTVSRIVPVLEPGAGVVTSRADVHYVVTEHGIAYSARKDAARAGRGADRDCRSAFQAGAGRFCRARALSGAQKRRRVCLRSGGRRSMKGDGRMSDEKMTEAEKRIGACCGSMEECKGCGLCVEACPPKVIG